MDRLIFSVVLVLGLYLPFESIIIRYLPGPAVLDSLLYMGVEAIIYLLFCILVTVRLAERKLFRRTIIDLPIIIILIVAVVSLVKNDSDVMASVHNIRAMFRYIVLFYILANLKYESDAIEKLFRIIILVGVIQSFLAITQFLGGEGIKTYFYSQQIDYELAGQSVTVRDPSMDRVGAGIGTLGQPSILAMFLLISLIVTSSMFFGSTQKKMISTIMLLVSMLLIMAGIFTTYKRAAMLFAILIPVTALLLSDRKKSLVPSATIIIISCGLFLAIYLLIDEGAVVTGKEAREHQVALSDLLNNLFTAEYWTKSATTSRLWFLRESLVTIIGSVNLLGYGPDPKHAIQLFVADRVGLGRLIDYYAYKDVYWMAILVYYGILGFSAWMYVLWNISKNAKRLIDYNLQFPLAKQLAIAVLILIAITFIYTFVERTLVIRAYAFYFWALAGILSSFVHQIRNEKNEFESYSR